MTIHPAVLASLSGVRESEPRRAAVRNYELEAQLSAFDRMQAAAGVRVGAAAVDALQPVVPLSTQITLGTPQRRRFFGELVMPPLPHSAWKIQVPSFGTEHLQIHDTERGWGVERARTDFAVATVEFEMERHGLESPVDRGLLGVADNRWRLPFRAAQIARAGVMLNAEWRRALLLGETTNYAASHTVDLTGSEWNAAAGDSLATIETGIAQIRTARPGYERRHMRLALSEGGWLAVQNDPTWLAIRANFTDRFPTPEEAYRAYIGIASVDVADASVTIGGTAQSLWGDVGILYVDGALAGDLDDGWGEAVFAKLHTYAAGQVFGPYFEDRSTTDWYVFDMHSLPVMHGNNAAYFMYNVRS